MPKNKKPTYEELEQHLVEAEQMLDALRRGEVDAVLAQEQPIVLRPRELERKLKESEAALIEAQSIAKIGSWQYDVVKDKLTWSPEMFRIFDRDPDRGVPKWEEHQEHIHPDDWPRIDRERSRRLEGKPAYRGVFRIIRRDGSITWAETTGRSQQKKDGKPVKLSGTVQDITERKLAEQALEESRKLLHRSEEIANTGGWEFDPATGKQKWTEGTYRLHEVDPDYEPTVEKGLSFFPPPDARTQISQAIQLAVDKGEPYDLELPFVTAKGRKRWVRTIGMADRDKSVTTRVYGTIQDITTQKVAEDALRQSEKNFRTAFEYAPEGMALIDGERRFIDVNQRVCEILGYSKEELLGKSFNQFTHPDDREDGRERWRQLLEGQSDTNRTEKKFIHKNGRIVWVLVSNVTIRNEKGELQYILSHMYDITSRVNYQRDLIRERDLSQKYLDTAGVILVALDHEGRITMINRQGCLVLDCEIKKALGQYWIENYIPEESRQEVRKIFDNIMAGLVEFHAAEENEVITESGERRLIRWNNAVLRDPEGNITGTLSSGEDITEKKAAQESINRLAAIVESSQDAIIGKDLNGIITSWNKAAERIYGYSAEEANGKHISLIVPEEKSHEVDQISEAVRRGEPTRVAETVRRRKDGSLIDVSLSVSPVRDDTGRVVGAATIAHDISEIKKARQEKEKLEGQLRQSQKMEAIGTLAGGIAHDFNNILAAIMGYSELALDELPPDSEAAQNLNTVVTAANRAKDLTYQILSFSRQTERKQVTLDLEPIIKEILKMLRATLPTTIEIKQNVPAGTGKVMADPVQIHQILMNLCTNAAQAMEESGGVLSVALDVVDFDDSTSNGYVDLAPGKYQRLSVSDTGVGMDKEVLERIFEPFYTTKEIGKGTGMGLSVVHGIVKNYGGDITVYSEPGQGSTFHVYLPLADGEQKKEPALLIGELPRGSENILFVDDEPPLVDIGKKTLSRLGYQVQGFTSAQEALEAFKDAPDDFNLLITDYTMPKMTGVQLANEILAIKPDLPIIVCTGFSERLDSDMAQETGVARLVMKPFVPREIARVVREVLDRK